MLDTSFNDRDGRVVARGVSFGSGGYLKRTLRAADAKTPTVSALRSGGVTQMSANGTEETIGSAGRPSACWDQADAPAHAGPAPLTHERQSSYTGGEGSRRAEDRRHQLSDPVRGPAA